MCACSRRATGCRCRLSAAPHSSIPRSSRRSRSTLLSTTWDRTERVGLAWSANADVRARVVRRRRCPARRSSETMERLRDGPVYELASSASGRRHRTSLQLARRSRAGALARTASPAGVRRQPFVDRREARTRQARRSSASSWTAQPARAWEYTTDGATSRSSGRELALWATDEIPVTLTRRHRPRAARLDHRGIPRTGRRRTFRGAHCRRASAPRGTSFPTSA